MQRRTFLQAGLAATAWAARKYRAAIIGHTGRGDYGHGWDTAFSRFDSIEVAAVADPDDGGRAKAQKRSRALRGYRDYREMLRQEKPGLCAICPRWLDQRREMFLAAAEAGAHILMEKPFARDLADADAMVAAAERHRLKVQVGHTARLAPVTLRALEMVRAGEIGVLLEMRARGKEDQRAGGEDLMVLGTHCFDLMRLFAGDPRWVFAHVSPATPRQPTEPIGPVAGDEIAAMFLFDGGVHGYFGSKPSGQRDGRRFGLTLYGSQGAIFIPLTAVPSAPPLVLRSSDWTANSDTGYWQPVEATPVLKTREGANAVMVRDWIEAIERGREPACNAREARWTIEMVMGIYQSEQAGARVAFPLKERRHPLSTRRSPP